MKTGKMKSRKNKNSDKKIEFFSVFITVFLKDENSMSDSRRFLNKRKKMFDSFKRTFGGNKGSFVVRERV